MPDNNRPTPASQWRVAEAIQLPNSGNVALLKRLHILDLAGLGYLPDTLTAKVQQAFFDAESAQLEDDAEAAGRNLINQLGLAGFYDLLAQLCKAVFVQPRVVDEPAEGAEEIAPSDINFDDRVWLFTWVMGADEEVAENLGTFLSEQDESMEPASTGEELRPEAVDAGGAG